MPGNRASMMEQLLSDGGLVAGNANRRRASFVKGGKVPKRKQRGLPTPPKDKGPGEPNAMEKVLKGKKKKKKGSALA